jgi:phosphoglycolate phosphatase
LIRIDFPVAIASVSLDLDGTLLDTVPDLAVAANGMLCELGLPGRSDAELRTFVGGGIPRFVLYCLPDGKREPSFHTAAIETFKRHYAGSNGKHSVLYPGVMEGLEGFKRLGIPMACITNKAAAFSEPLLQDTGLMSYFSFVLSGDSLPEKKPHPLPLLETCRRLGTNPAAHMHIGDSKHDAAAALAAGCISVTVPYGYNEGEDVRQMATNVIVPSVEAALELLSCVTSRPN